MKPDVKPDVRPGMTTEPVLELRGLHKRFGAQVAVDRLDLALRPHEFMTFLGPSGSGKTTTLMMVAGLLQPDAGAVLLDGKPVDKLPPYRRDLGMVFQNYALFPHMTVRRNVAFPLEMRRVGRAEAARLVSDVLRLVGLPDHDHRLPRELSGGQQQRVALARALIYRPALLLMDEPLGALDRKLRGEMQLEIKRVHRERRMSVLYVTHDQEEALTMSDRIAIFNGGRVEQVGTPAEVYEHPATRFVAGFIGETNFFPGLVAAGPLRVVADGQDLPCRMPGGIVAGSSVDVAVRPERIRLVSEPGGTGGKGSLGGLGGTVSDVIYLGNARKIIVRLQSGQPATVSAAAELLEASGLEPGQGVRLSWPAEHGTAFVRD